MLASWQRAPIPRHCPSTTISLVQRESMIVPRPESRVETRERSPRCVFRHFNVQTATCLWCGVRIVITRGGVQGWFPSDIHGVYSSLIVQCLQLPSGLCALVSSVCRVSCRLSYAAPVRTELRCDMDLTFVFCVLRRDRAPALGALGVQLAASFGGCVSL